jgi:hypothetical protein
MTERVLIGSTFLGISLVGNEKLNVYGFCLYLTLFMLRCETISLKDCGYKEYRITLGLMPFLFAFSFSHPCLTIENEKKA